MGRSIASVGDPKVSKGERREAGIQWIQPPKAVSDPEFRQTTSGAHGSANRADCLPRGKPFGAPAGAYTCIGTPTPRRGCRGASGKPPCLHEERQLCRKKFPLGGGLTRRLRREWMGLPPRRGIVLSFDAKESTKESVRHGDSGKKPFIAHFDGGARYVARSRVGQITHAIVRARSSPFSAVKMGGPFSLRCLSPLCSPAVGVGHAYPLQVEKFQCG